MSEPEKRKRQHGRSTAVLEYLKKNPNVLVSINEIQTATNLERDQVSSAMSHLRDRTGLNIETPLRGQYIFHTGPKAPIQPKAKVGDALYEFVGTTLGVTIIRDEQNELYVPVPLSQYLDMKGSQ